jgi:hypothetical protein
MAFVSSDLAVTGGAKLAHVDVFLAGGRPFRPRGALRAQQK